MRIDFLGLRAKFDAFRKLVRGETSEVTMAMSSAKALRTPPEGRASERSKRHVLMAITNREPDKGQPCRTPQRTGKRKDTTPPTQE